MSLYINASKCTSVFGYFSNKTKIKLGFNSIVAPFKDPIAIVTVLIEYGMSAFIIIRSNCDFVDS